ncbi:M20/M25/M40 family metallo-hydrolase [Gemmatimonas sp.]|uniref:M20/M25/M40 family metallo-hydrolase n=1 Tax=Gemmatimonas sp. TaxID=1962908 RepID=UPI003DA23DFF
MSIPFRLSWAAALLPALLPALLAAQRGVPRTSVASPDAEIYLVPLSLRGDTVRAGNPVNLTRRAGYDNQPMFTRDSRAIYYTANLGDGQSDIYRFDLGTGLTRPVQRTRPESEYSAAPILGDTAAVAVIRVEADSTQRLWRLPLNGGAPSVLIADLKPVGYFAQPNDSTWVTFVLGTPATLQVVRAGQPGAVTLARDIGRSLHRIPGTRFVSFVQRGTQPWQVMRLDVSTNRIDTLVALPEGTEDMTWVDSTTMLAGQGTTLLQWTRGSGSSRTAWRTVADFSYAPLQRISRLAVSPSRQWLAMVAESAPRGKQAASTSAAARVVDRIDTTRVRRGLAILAADSMEGRLTGSPGMERAANGDSINNGADDDASGNIALLEIARALRNGPRPKRTIRFMSITGEEVGGFGTRWYLQHPLLPLANTVVDLNIEMIAHPDSLAGGFGKAWLTGYERSTLGDLLADNGIPLVADPRPGQSFFTRSDNAAFARIGIPAHSLSSFNLATPYHDPRDEVGAVNVAHMAQVIGATAKAVRLLSDGPRPVWHPGGQPEVRPTR